MKLLPKVENLKDLLKQKEKSSELCEVHIIGTPELILKLMGKEKTPSI